MLPFWSMKGVTQIHLWYKFDESCFIIFHQSGGLTFSKKNLKTNAAELCYLPSPKHHRYVPCTLPGSGDKGLAVLFCSYCQLLFFLLAFKYSWRITHSLESCVTCLVPSCLPTRTYRSGYERSNWHICTFQLGNLVLRLLG